MYVTLPTLVDHAAIVAEFGRDAANYYENRISERQAQGHIYMNPLKTAYIWAHEDRRSGQGFYSVLQYRSGKKIKNHGRS